jgi:hypothetical protein
LVERDDVTVLCSARVLIAWFLLCFCCKFYGGLSSSRNCWFVHHLPLVDNTVQQERSIVRQSACGGNMMNQSLFFMSLRSVLVFESWQDKMEESHKEEV